MITRTRDYIYLFYRPFDFKRVGRLSCVCIDIEGAPEVCSLFVCPVKINADIRRLALGKQFLLESCSKAFAGRIDGVNHELLVACIAIDKVERVTGIIPVQRQVADGVVEDYRRWLRTLSRAREEKAEMNTAHDGEKVSGMTHRMSRS